MARPKKGDGPSKADHIRAAIKTNPRAKTSEIVRLLSDKGVKVLANHVYALKNKMKKKKFQENRMAARDAARDAGMTNPIQAVLEVRSLAMKLGGITHLKRLVDLLAER